MKRIIGVLLVAVVLQACARLAPVMDRGHPTAFAAIQQGVEQQARQAGVSHMMGKPAIKMQRPLLGHVVAVVSYDAVINGQQMQMLSLLYLTAQHNVWWYVGGTTQSHPTSATLPPVQYLQGALPESGSAYGPAGGLVHDPAVQKLVVTFDDGSHIETEVEDGAYVLAKQQAGRVITVEAVAHDRHVLYTVPEDTHRSTP